MNPNNQSTYSISPTENFIINGCVAATSKTVAAPIERVKLLLQTQEEMIKNGQLKVPYKGVIDCTTRVLTEEGFLSFWQGNYILVTWYIRQFTPRETYISKRIL